MYEQEFDIGGSQTAPRSSLPHRTLAVFRRVLLRAHAALKAGITAVRTFGPINTARAWLAGPLFRLRQAIAWGRARTGLPMAGALGLGAFALSDRGRAWIRKGWAALGVLASKAMTGVGRFLVRHPLPAPVQSAGLWVARMAGTALAPVKAGLSTIRVWARKAGVTARRGSYAFTVATAAKLLVSVVPAVLVLGLAVSGLVLFVGIKGRKVETPDPTDPSDPEDTDPQGPAPASAPSPDAQTVYMSMEHLAEVLPKIRQAVKEAVASGDKEGIRDARRLLSSCRARTGEMKKAAAALRAGGSLPAELLPVLDDIDALVAEMTAEWAGLSQQLRDATANRSTRRAAASQARRQWSPTAAEAL